MFNDQITFPYPLLFLLLILAVPFSVQAQESIQPLSAQKLLQQADSLVAGTPFEEVALLYEQAIAKSERVQDMSALMNAYESYGRLC
ncbi:MAG: hypothetical protein AB8G22_18300, partial [Saprospiraceae bacterium]